GHEGTYQMEVSVQDKNTGETASAAFTFELTSRLKDSSNPVISPTDHPLVFLYSAPSCPLGGGMRVHFQSEDGATQTTPFQACRGIGSMNFYVAGMRPQFRYMVWHTLAMGGDVAPGPTLAITTPAVSVAPPTYKVLQAPSQAGILLQCALYVPFMAT